MDEKRKPDYAVMVEQTDKDGKKSWKRLGVIYLSASGRNDKYAGALLLGNARLPIFKQ